MYGAYSGSVDDMATMLTLFSCIAWCGSRRQSSEVGGRLLYSGTAGLMTNEMAIQCPARGCHQRYLGTLFGLLWEVY